MQYSEAINYDLLTKTGHELKDVGRTLSWGALDDFLSYVDYDSALMRELNPDIAGWSNLLKTNAILADIYDELAMINANLVAMASRRPAKKPKLYPRPGKEKADKDTRHFGAGAMPPDDLRKWIEEKRAEHGRGSTGHNNGHSSP